eukprot:gene13148-17616_t
MTCAAENGCVNQDPIIPKGANSQGKPRDAIKDCIDRYDVCAQYAAQGECEINPGWMIISCAKSCNACEIRDPKIRCARTALNMSTEPIYRPGDMERMFQTVVSRFGNIYDIKILSTSPWVVTFDNFISDVEADALIGTVDKWERSTDTGDMNEFGESGRILSSGRTSSNAWCNKECQSNAHVKQILRKIEEITTVPRQNYESFQILRYEKGQRYQTHHDYGSEDVSLAC